MSAQNCFNAGVVNGNASLRDYAEACLKGYVRDNTVDAYLAYDFGPREAGIEEAEKELFEFEKLEGAALEAAHEAYVENKIANRARSRAEDAATCARAHKMLSELEALAADIRPDFLQHMRKNLQLAIEWNTPTHCRVVVTTAREWKEAQLIERRQFIKYRREDLEAAKSRHADFVALVKSVRAAFKSSQ